MQLAKKSPSSRRLRFSQEAFNPDESASVLMTGLPDVVDSDSVEALMAVRVETVEPKRSLKYALQKMVKRNIGSIVVVEEGTPVGIVTERDISRYVAKRTNALKTPVRNVMSGPLITVARSVDQPGSNGCNAQTRRQATTCG